MVAISSSTQAPIMMTMGDYGGTLAVVRSYGKHNQPTLLADPKTSTLTHKSRYLSKALKSPPVEDFESFVNWLIEYGKQNPGAFLYPSSDDMTWLISRYRDQLSDYYKLYSPDVKTIYALLNKPELHAIAEKLGIPVPSTVAPTSVEDLKAQAHKLRYPVLIKPRTQIGMLRRQKGQVCETPEKLLEIYPDYQQKFYYHPLLIDFDPEVNWPMVQEFHATAGQNTYSVAGFVDESQEIFLTRASAKVLQFPIRVGVGLCFESRPLNPKAIDHLKAICREVGYYGVFEAEFIVHGNQLLLMDFNPRFYGQMAFELERKLPLDQLVLAYANNDSEYGKVIQKQDQTWDHHKVYRFSNRWRLWLILTTQAVVGRFSWAERRKWLIWAGHTDTGCDPVYTDDDPNPRRADILSVVKSWIKHPRSTFKTFFADL
ncbi:hypothetical protein SPB21_04230 [Leptothoe sp. ISB3NOV94-8A]|uniref:ATP-grasp domain-containing protein n=1 Tax=Adonisia turfae CCMR0081 TaxID=2292702 RepID=A0A6M0RLG5_9CYAN|nr:hypothetical protein [Adonisia turfae]NEZ57055.1 hypothetical protein [Adonisia turfae CCMR0081]